MIAISLNDHEVALILAIRKRFRHGEIVLMVRDGIPQYIKKAWSSEELREPRLTDLTDTPTVKP